MTENEMGTVIVDRVIQLHRSLGPSFRADLVVEDKVIVGVKSVERINSVHKKQLLTYLKLTDLILRYLLNFGDELMKNGISRTIHGELNP